MTDTDGLSADASVTITVNDVNEAPTETTVEANKPKDQFQMAGDMISWTVDLTNMFDDQDADDGTLKYSLRSNELPESAEKALELDLTVSRDGEGKVTGTITSSKGIWGNVKPGSFDVTIIATDDDDHNPMSGEATFTVHVDDRNDEITGIKLYDLNEDGTDGDENLLYVVDVDENHDAEVNLGRITIQDADRAEHPHGQHEVKVDDKRFDIKVDDEGGLWLILKAGNALDHEDEKDGITLTITAEDMLTAEGKAAGAKTSTLTQVVMVDINDLNDDPKGLENEKMGNWWVTVNDELDAEDVDAGEWLSFQLESGDDFYAAFTDEDSGENGKLTYKLVNSPNWLMIDNTGVIQNKKGMLPPEEGGKFMITVEATDGGGGTPATVQFYLTVAMSGPNNDGNDEPSLDKGPDLSVKENADAGIRVATFTVDDDDSHLEGHPFAPNDPVMTSAVNGKDSNDQTDYRGNFELKHVSGNMWEVVTKGKGLDYETVERVEITISVNDPVGVDAGAAADTLEIDVDIEDVNEAPELTSGYTGAGSANVAVNQAGGKQYLWINAYSLWNDPDERQDDDDLTFTATSNVPWIRIVDEGEWEDVQLGKDRDDGGTGANADLTWGTYGSVFSDTARDAPEDDRDHVILVEIDRTGGKQEDVAKGGEITLTATDEGGKTGTKTVKVSVTDENLDIGADAVTIGGNEREGMTLTATFKEEKDPDLVGSPEAYQVIYTWSATENADGTGGTVRQVGAGNTYTMTQADVGMYISVSVTYRELEMSNGDTDFTADDQPAGTAVTDDMVRNTADPGKVYFNLHVNDARNGLTAEAVIMDEDGVPDEGEIGAPVYTWERSVNGVSGWKAVTTDTVTSDKDLALNDGDGGYYRLVVTYTDQQDVAERHASDGIQVGDLSAPEPAPELSAQSAVVGSTLRVNNPGSEVKWQQQHGTGDNAYWKTIQTDGTLAIKSDHEGAMLRAVVSHFGSDGLVATTVLAVNGGREIAALPNNMPTTVKATDYIDQDVDQVAAVTKVMGMIDVGSLFEDLDGDKLTFTVTDGPGGPGSDLVQEGANHAAIWMSANDEGLMSFDASTGELVYVTDEKSGHDGDTRDGTGNVVMLTVQASDEAGETAEATVGVRLNVAPMKQMEGRTTATIEENGQGAVDLISDLNVIDENSPMHDYGKYAWEIEGDDEERFTIKVNTADSSKAVLAVKANQKFEAAGGDGMITLTLVATEVGNPANEVTHKVTITVTNDPNDDPERAPTAPEGNKVPGLKDNENSDDDDRADGTDDGDNDDTDGGWYEPPAGSGMMVIDNDLLDSFVLAIDDIDAA